MVTITFSPSSFEILYSRSVYNALDFLGDVGGLFDGLKLLLGPIIGLLSQGGLSKWLISRLFYLPPPKGPHPKQSINYSSRDEEIIEAYNFAKGLRRAQLTTFSYLFSCCFSEKKK